MRILSICIFTLVIMLIAGCFSDPPYPKMPKCKSNRELSAQDMSKLSWEYQGFSITGAIQTSAHPPVDKITKLWQMDQEDLAPRGYYTVDRNGQVIYTAGFKLEPAILEKLHDSDILVPVPPTRTFCKVNRVNSDGSIAYRKTLAEYQDFIPFAIFNNAIIIYSWGKYGNATMSRLECIDYDFNTIWCTEPIEQNSLQWPRAWLISPDEIMRLVGHNVADMRFNVYDIRRGNLKETIHFTDIDEIGHKLLAHDFFGDSAIVIRLKDNNWIGLINHIVAGFDSDLRLKWHYERPAQENRKEWYKTTYLSNKTHLMTSTLDELYVFNVYNGEIVWQPPKGREYIAAGVTLDGNFVYYSKDSDKNSSWLNVATPSGELIWSYSVPDYPKNNSTIIYGDGSILFSHSQGIVLVDELGNTIWEFRNKDFGIPDNAKAVAWRLFPTPDKRIICQFSFKTKGSVESEFLCLGSAQ